MNSRVLAGLLVAGCVAAAGAGGYLAVRHDAVQPVPVAASPATTTSPAAAPVSETEAVVGGESPKPQPEAAPAVPVRSEPSSASSARETARTPAPAVHHESAPAPVPAPKQRTISAPPTSPAPSSVTAERQTPPPAAPTQTEATQEPARTPDPPPAPRVPQFEEVVVPASSVIGLEVDTALSSERAQVEDRVDARVTRDVMADGHVAIPAGSRVIGSVTVVDRGGKVKQPARLGVRFHTLVLADGREVSLRTEPIYREGAAPGPESARKIGGAAVGGAILGAIIGGGKGAAIGSAVGAAGGSAAVMAGDRNAATLTPGTVVTVHLSAPATIEVEKRDQQ